MQMEGNLPIVPHRPKVPDIHKSKSLIRYTTILTSRRPGAGGSEQVRNDLRPSKAHLNRYKFGRGSVHLAGSAILRHRATLVTVLRNATGRGLTQPPPEVVLITLS